MFAFILFKKGSRVVFVKLPDPIIPIAGFSFLIFFLFKASSIFLFSTSTSWGYIRMEAIELLFEILLYIS